MVKKRGLQSPPLDGGSLKYSTFHLSFNIDIMVKYLSRSLTTLLLCTALLLSLAAASVAPVPSCNSPRTALNDLPISLRETQSFDLNDFFSGYNLNFSIPTRPEFVFLREKLTTLKQTPKNQSGLRNYHLASEGNSWGATLVTLSVFGNDTTLRWGSTPANESLPVLTNEAVVTNDPTMHCYDAVWFRAEQVALVDCAKNSTFGLQNYFLYLNTSSKTILPPVKNDMYVPFTNIYHRKIRLLTEDGYHYLIRAYFAEHVDQWDHNTYAEIMSVNNPLKPWTIRVLDRSFLHQDKLSIMDFEVYLGDIYILDYHSGVIKFDITTSQTIVIVGRYRTDSGFTKMGVFSSNMVNEFLLVLAHDHAIYEIDWTNQIKPEIITKYSVPEGAWMHDLWVNQGYVVAQITSNLTDPKTNQTSAYQSTYVFTRGSRTYLNAYIAVPHPNFHAFVDLHRENSQMLIIDTDGYSLHQISTPRLSVMPQNPELKNKEFSFTVRAVSTNEYTKEALPCTFTFKYLVVDNDSLAIWTTGRKLPDTYYANYPGQLFIPLDRYALGPNITYGVYTEDKEPPTHFILQQNTTRIEWWNKTHNILKYTFLRQEQYDTLDETVLYLYTQDHGNFTHFSKCITVPYTDEVHCIDSGYAPHIDFHINNLTANRFHYYGSQYLHLAAIVYEEFPNEIFVYDVEHESRMDLRPITFPAGFEGQIQSIEFLGNYLVVVLRYVKEIVFFDMVQCYDHQDKECEELFRIDSRTMDRIGVNYFSPFDVYTSDFHPYVLFVQCLDRVLILDITPRGPIKLAEIKSPATQEPGFYKWKMGIARGELILVNPPNIIEEHDLDEIYLLRDAPMTKVYPTFGYVIPDKFDLDFSDTGNLIYIQALDPKLPEGTNSVILVYKTGLPAVSAFYDVFHLYQRHDDLLIDVTGSFGDYVAVAFGSVLMMYRQYEIPILVFEDTFSDFTFNLTFTNDPEARFQYTNKATVKIANYPEDILINDTRFNSGYLSTYLSEQISNTNGNNSRWIPLDDEPWFNGSVLNYTLLNGNDKLKVINHVNQERVMLGVHDMEDYAFSFDGGFIQQFQSIIKMRHNGSIEQFVTLPSALDGESCISIEHHWIYDYTLSACKNSNEVYLYTTVYTASKPFVNGPYYSSAQHVTSMHVMDELMMIVDVNERPWSFDREGGVIIYAMNHDPFEPEIFDEVEYINSDDLSAALHWPGGPCFIGNAHFSFTNLSNTYRLVITELRSGFFVVDFRWTRGRKSVEILKVEFIDLAEEMNRIHVPLPNAAFFTAIAINKNTYEANFSYWRTQVIVATSNFHSFQVDLHIDRTGTVVSHEISKIYYRYGFYESENYIKAFDGYFALGQRLPVMLEPFDWYSKTVLAVYDTYDHWTFNSTTGEQEPAPVQYHANTTIPVQFMLGGYTFPKGRIAFDWNFTFTRNSSNPLRRLGLLAVHNSEARFRELSVHERLIIVKEDGLDQNMDLILRARNDYHQLDIPFKLKVLEDDVLPGWAIALIVIGSVALAAVIAYAVFLKFVKGKRPNRESEITEKSLLEHEGEAEGDKDSDSDEDEEEEDDEEDGEDVEEQGYQPPKVDGSADPTAAVTSSVNRETISSVDEVEAHLAAEGDKPEEKQGE